MERGADWTQEQISPVVLSYFTHLRLELGGQRFNKAAEYRRLSSLVGRSEGAIGRKWSNISAVLEVLGLCWMKGLLPLRNFQAALILEVEKYIPAFEKDLSKLHRQPEVGLNESSLIIKDQVAPRFDDNDLPNQKNLQSLVRKFDPAARDARNREIGRLGEERVYFDEKFRLAAVGRSDLARKVEWTSEERGDGAGYDIRSFYPDGKERLLEVKTTVGHQRTPFYMSSNELEFSGERPEAFRLVRLYQFTQVPRSFELLPPLNESVILKPTNYRASF